MNKQEKSYFDSLIKSRKEGADVFDKPEYRGVKKSVVDKYSDQAHFIYELLQNADDAKATSARFVLNEDNLVFAHNGTKKFSVSNPETHEKDDEKGILGDINSITSIGSSSKKENSIGKFGVGFKSVFQYTNTPHIYDQNFLFKIERFIVPKLLDADHQDRKKEETLFMFPFDKPEQINKEVYQHIENRLKTLEFPILFLSNLKRIEYKISDSTGYYEKSISETYHTKDIHAELLNLSATYKDKSKNDKLWLFSRKTEDNLSYSVGFFLDDSGNLKPYRSKAFCYFTTQKDTGLNFIVHAPFLLTDSREGIKEGDPHNLKMLSLLSKLAAESFLVLKDIGVKNNKPLITDNIFEIIPYQSTCDFNDSFYTEIKNTFQTHPILPSTDSYTTKDNACWASRNEHTNIFSNEQLTELLNKSNVKWVFISKSRENVTGKLLEYIDSLVPLHLDEDKLIESITASFIEKQTIDWLHNLYKWLSRSEKRQYLSKTVPIFLNKKNKAVKAFDRDGSWKLQPVLFLPIEGGSGFDTINESLITDEEMIEVIEKLGIKKPSLKDEIIMHILPKYINNTILNETELSSYKNDFKKIFKCYLECPHGDIDDFLKLLKKYHFILYKFESDENQYLGKAGELYFPTEGLKKWFEVNPETKFVVDDFYASYDKIDDFFSKLGMKKKVRINSHNLEKKNAYKVKDLCEKLAREISDKKRQAYMYRKVYPRFTMPQMYWESRKWKEMRIDTLAMNIKDVEKNKDFEKSIYIWDSLLKFQEYIFFDDEVFFGEYTYETRSTTKRERFEAEHTVYLRYGKWLVDQNGIFKSPASMHVNELHPDYNMENYYARKLIDILHIKEPIVEARKNDNLMEEFSDLTEEEQREALEEKRRQKNQSINTSQGNASTEKYTEIDINNKPTSKPLSSVEKTNTSETNYIDNEEEDDDDDQEDYIIKSLADFSKKAGINIKRIENEKNRIEKAENIIQILDQTKKYSYEWFDLLIKLELLVESEKNPRGRELSVSFRKVEAEIGSTRTIILKHPTPYIPQAIEDQTDIPIELTFQDSKTQKIILESASIKSYTLRVKLKSSTELDNIDLSQVTEAKIKVKDPIFLLEELQNSFAELGYDKDFDMKENLCKNIEFIFGPPGTGKTTYLAENIISPIMKSLENNRILVLTPTNKAADVLVKRTMDVMSSDSSYLNWLVRFGTTHDDEIELSGVYKDKSFNIHKSLKCVVVTTIDRFPYDYFMPTYDKIFLKDLDWDYIIIDEASMIPIIKIIYPLYKKVPKMFIIAGDPLQIEPIAVTDENIYSMVGLESFTKPQTNPHQYDVKLLTTQYRSIPIVGEIFSKFAYGGVLKHDRYNESQVPLNIPNLDIKALNIIKFPVSKYESIYRPKKLKTSNYHVYSAIFAYEFAIYLAEMIDKFSNLNTISIGIIAPYRVQADLIEKLTLSATLPKNIKVQVGTIHGFQGDECDIIIAVFNPPMSITTSKDMFLNKKNIINVSISRARDYLFIIMPDDNTDNVDNLKLIKRIERLCSQVDHTMIETKEIEKIIWNSETYIEDNSFATSHQKVNVYGEPEHRYEIRSESEAVDVQIHKIHSAKKYFS